MPKVETLEHPLMVPTVTFDEYKDKYKDHFILERSKSGVLMAKWHTNGGSLLWNLAIHRAIHQLTTDAGQDVENEVFILTGAGPNWIGGLESFIDETDDVKKWLVYEHLYYDGTNIQEGLVFDLEIPTIGAINGPGFHTELALFCDITIMSEDAFILDPHYATGMIPGDGVQIAYRECIGYKRANWAMLMGEKIDAEKALHYGMVNEVVPKDKIYERAWEIGEYLAKSDRMMRRLTVQVIRQPLKVALSKELRGAFATEMMHYMSSSSKHPQENLETMKKRMENDLKKK